MQAQVKKLYEISRKKERMIVGLMSGTSLDGLDVALCKVRGSGLNTTVNLLHFQSLAYTKKFKDEIRKVFAKQDISFLQLCLLNEQIAIVHASMIMRCLSKWKVKNTDVDLIASHGQTVYHAPRIFHKKKQYGNATLQIGDGDHIANRTGIITVSDFRQKHIAAGGEGAPLATYGDTIMFREKGVDVILLNIGGVSNFTFLGAGKAYYSTDIGPGNNLMDIWVHSNFGNKSFDKNSAIAMKGRVNDEFVAALWREPFLKLPFPKSTGPETFNLAFINSALKKSGADNILVEDVMASLNLFTAQVISRGLNKAIGSSKSVKIYVSGGGWHNPLLMDYIRQFTKCTHIYSSAERGLNPDAKEAVLFALLANETVSGANSIFGKEVQNFPAVSMGKISFPL